MESELKDLKRYPLRKNELLQAWDSADELILSHLSTLDLNDKRILVVGDSFGALTCMLKSNKPQTFTDSFVSAQGIQLNCGADIMGRLSDFEGAFDLVLIKLPKNLSFFEDILCHLSQHLHQSSQIICGAMVKHLPTGCFDLLQKYIGPTTTSLAVKKARLIFANFSKGPVTSPYPFDLTIEGFEHPLSNNSNLFSREKLDIGTRFFLDHIPTGVTGTILDLGCANGIVGIRAKLQNPHSSLIFTDESQMAVDSAQVNYQRFFKDEARYIWGNCFENQPSNFLDAVLCNPPFHQNNTVGDFIARQMFHDAHHSLKKGGLLRIIGNSHLGYQNHLKRIFSNSKIIATNTKFMIVDAIK